MPRLIVPATAVSGTALHLDGAGAHHLVASLRARPGDQIQVVDSDAMEHDVRITEVSSTHLSGDIIESRAGQGEPRLRIHVIQALPKSSFDVAIDMMVQAGVSVIHPVVSQRTVATPTQQQATQRLQRWQTIAHEAAQLAYRAAVPEVRALTSLTEALSAIPHGSRVFACVLNDTAVALSQLTIDTGVPVVVCIGPEGGFGPDDIAALTAAHAEFVHMGARVFRSRMAGAIAATLLLVASGDLEATTNGPDAV